MFGWRLEKGSAPLWLRALIPVISIIVTFLLTTVLLALARANPFAAFYALMIEPLRAAHALPGPLVIALMLAGGFIAGMLWALVPALLRTRLGVDEVVTTLLLNTVMLYLINAILNAFWLDPVTNWPQSPRIAVDYPVIVPGSRVH